MEKDSDRQEVEVNQAEAQEEISEKKDSQYPATVPLCPMCKLTQEICEYGNKPKKCLEYYEKTNKSIYDDLKARIEAISKKKGKGDKQENADQGEDHQDDEKVDNDKPIEEDGEEKKDKKAPEIEKQKDPKKPKNIVMITVTRKKGKSFITEIVGLDKFEIDEKKFCKPLGKKFATGASFTKGEGIIMQGDLADKMTEFMLESFPGQIDANDIEIVRKK